MAHITVGIAFTYGIPESLPDLGPAYDLRASDRAFLQAYHRESGKTYYVASSTPGQPPGHTLYRLRPATAEEATRDPDGNIRHGELVIDDQDTIHIPATP